MPRDERSSSRSRSPLSSPDSCRTVPLMRVCVPSGMCLLKKNLCPYRKDLAFWGVGRCLSGIHISWPDAFQPASSASTSALSVVVGHCGDRNISVEWALWDFLMYKDNAQALLYFLSILFRFGTRWLDDYMPRCLTVLTVARVRNLGHCG